MCYSPTFVKCIIAGKREYIPVPCRWCFQCRQERANEWALRCFAEGLKYDKVCFITLTYEKSPLILLKSHVQRFIKRLRRELGDEKIRYFLCGEYGDLRLRPHFHIIVFGYYPDDCVSCGKSHSGFPMYTSKQIHDIWCNDTDHSGGRIVVMPASHETYSYIALYASKSRKSLPEALQAYPEFNLMSRGLGNDYLIQKFNPLLDSYYVNGFKYKTPRAIVDKIYKKDEYKRRPMSYSDFILNRRKNYRELSIAEINNKIRMIEEKGKRKLLQKRLTDNF